ncbi:MAG TPA: dTDP-4-dehydrorhamnose 3,5-epimerase [Cyclobacteriaceae bacterium]|nr:dTDP-4-dehydrorhamnose 3,5-epimerase [Cyclobacteriaceae bacterium]
MKAVSTGFNGLIVLEPQVFVDSRGYFFEAYSQKAYQAIGIDARFIQDNQSFSTRGVLRGLHFQRPPYQQAKLVRVLSGRIQDIAVDLRKSGSTFGKYFSIELSEDNKKQLFIPKGFAHGFLVLSETAQVMYKVDADYHAASEDGIHYNDSTLQIAWQSDTQAAIVSEKDKVLPYFSSEALYF